MPPGGLRAFLRANPSGGGAAAAALWAAAPGAPEVRLAHLPAAAVDAWVADPVELADWPAGTLVWTEVRAWRWNGRRLAEVPEAAPDWDRDVDARYWVGARTWLHAWRACERPEWMVAAAEGVLGRRRAVGVVGRLLAPYLPLVPTRFATVHAAARAGEDFAAGRIDDEALGGFALRALDTATVIWRHVDTPGYPRRAVAPAYAVGHIAGGLFVAVSWITRCEGASAAGVTDALRRAVSTHDVVEAAMGASV